MTEKQLRDIYMLACDGKAYEPNDGQFKLWRTTLMWYEESDLAQALVYWFETNAEFPMPSDLKPLVARAREKRTNPKANEYFQQQRCPGCGSLVGAMRAVGDQFRTWCGPCQQYRKIVPEDLRLSDQWQAIVAEMHTLHRYWIDRGMPMNECVDPQVDRNTLQWKSHGKHRLATA